MLVNGYRPSSLHRTIFLQLLLFVIKLKIVSAQLCSPTDSLRFAGVTQNIMCIWDAVDATWSAPQTGDGPAGTFLVYAVGGSGGTSGLFNPGGLGGLITCTMTLPVGEQVTISLGGDGSSTGEGGKNGGGSSSIGAGFGSGGGGGGFTFVESSSGRIVAGGGGGGGDGVVPGGNLSAGGQGGVGLAAGQTGDSADETHLNGGEGASLSSAGVAGMSYADDPDSGAIEPAANGDLAGIGGNGAALIAAGQTVATLSGGGGGGGITGGGGGGIAEIADPLAGPNVFIEAGGGGGGGASGCDTISSFQVSDSSGSTSSKVVIFYNAATIVSGVPVPRKKRDQVHFGRCPKLEETACYFPSGGWECLDTSVELSSCGGCVRGGQGQDCLAIPHVQGVQCEGRCVVSSCAKGYKVSIDRRECVLEQYH